MPTLEELKQYLATLGISVPDFMLQAWLEGVDAMTACLAEHYPPATAKLIALYLLGLYGVAQGDRYVSSQTAPSGASQSFRFATLADRWRMQTSLLNRFDPFGCAGPYLPDDPTRGKIGMAVGLGTRANRGGGCC
jgi:hypothetical protein